MELHRNQWDFFFKPQKPLAMIEIVFCLKSLKFIRNTHDNPGVCFQNGAMNLLIRLVQKKSLYMSHTYLLLYKMAIYTVQTHKLKMRHTQLYRIYQTKLMKSVFFLIHLNTISNQAGQLKPNFKITLFLNVFTNRGPWLLFQCKRSDNSWIKIMESFSLDKTSKIIKSNQHCQVHHWTMSLNATSTFLLNTSRNGDSTT